LRTQNGTVKQFLFLVKVWKFEIVESAFEGEWLVLLQITIERHEIISKHTFLLLYFENDEYIRLIKTHEVIEIRNEEKKQEQQRIENDKKRQRDDEEIEKYSLLIEAALKKARIKEYQSRILAKFLTQ
jgi:uncharacterized membrane protein